MPTGMTLRTIMGLVMVILVLSLTGYFISSYLNPKCDLKSGDAYRDFIEMYRNCVKVNTEDVCKCGEFDIQEMTSNHKIMIVPFKRDEEDKVSISLFCNGRLSDNTEFGDDENPEKVRVYFPDPTKFDEQNYYEKYFKDVVEIKKGNKISDEILNSGFEMDSTRGFPVGKSEGNRVLLGNKNLLTLVNYRGDIAFVAGTVKQKEFLEKNELLPC